MKNRLEGVRFAPSPTGTFHIGNLRTAWISFAIARDIGQRWIVRFEDIDRPRIVYGAFESQKADLLTLGLHADETILQSSHIERHWELFCRGVKEGKLYPCYCSRKDVRNAIQGVASAPNAPVPLYSGHCRNLASAPKHDLPSIGWRFRAGDSSGHQDFLVARAGADSAPGNPPAKVEFVPSYHWACAIDDLDGHYSLLVRAWDLAEATPIQRSIQQWIDPKAELPAVFHTALVEADDGSRLEKRTQGITLAELIASRWTVEKLLSAFQTSFQWNAADLKPSAVFGEASKTLKLSELISR